ncbi:hypothetical protein [Mycolicibacterium llatzerense]|uniref:hypothetical protein n=1 Tax=Mycolicibacterium llatzerense TaxID=280871 RepID=UPI0021B6E24B|nr:hypothetical protein [Mycolicibacterium llatzerense]
MTSTSTNRTRKAPAKRKPAPSPGKAAARRPANRDDQAAPPPWVGHWPRLDGPQQPRYHWHSPDFGTADEGDAITAAKFAARVTGSRCFPWQWFELRGMLSRQDTAEGLWLHRDVCLVDTRQQGKTEAMVWRILYGLFYLGETCVYSAQRGGTADAVFDRIVSIVESRPDLNERVISKTGGKQGRGDLVIRSKYGKVAHLRCGVRSGDLGRGLDLIDLVVFDEAYNLTPAETAALTGAQSASPNQQTIYTSTAPVESLHPFCYIFAGVRERGMAGHVNPKNGDPDLWYSEYCAPPPPKDERERAKARTDRENWRLASPSHGVISHDRDIDSKRKTLCINAEGIAIWEADYLGWGEWPSTADNREQVIPIESVWAPLTDLGAELVGQIVVAVSRTRDRQRWAFAAGQRTIDGHVALELGAYEVMNIGQAARYLLTLIEAFDPAQIIIEGHDEGVDLVPVMRRLGFDLRVTTLAEFAIASSAFKDHAVSGDICHTDQPIIREGLEQLAERELPRGDKVIDVNEGSVAQVVAFALALWGVLEFAEEETETALPQAGGGPGGDAEVAAYMADHLDYLEQFGATSSHFSDWDLST